MTTDILIIDDEADIRDLVADILTDNGHTTRSAATSDEALKAIADRVPTAVILDIWLQGSELDGLGILEIIKSKYADVPVIMISGHGNIETAVNAIKMGAYDFIEKPFKEDRLLLMLGKAIELAQLKRENEELRVRGNIECELTGESGAITQTRGLLDKAAPTESRVFITGAGGSGKETAARYLHNQSARKAGPFVNLNVSGLADDAIEQLCFGAETTGRMGGIDKVGLFERAHGGTLFIDEVTDLPTSVQSKLLRILQDGHITRIGGTKPVPVNIRVIAATSTDIADEIAQSRFREDLYYRLNVVPVKLTALKDRTEDIPVLCDYFLKRAAKANGLNARRLLPETIATLQIYDWPGNVRQLKNIMEWLTIVTSNEENDTIRPNQLPHDVLSTNPVMTRPDVNADIMSLPLREARELFEKQYLSAQIGRFGGNISKTSAFVGMERSALHRKLKMLGLGGNQQPAEDRQLEKAG